ncbi:hypothetical protein FHR90_000806 [Endobacter medicaginis]|uniref:UPF0235 protein FHR90_000806 n=2 Tax=Endobacter medicaginis TaxID=1181271 RepID=A0A839URX0_9PROT|nr:DUF167 domain-containing protein [Endobacter medicaginis]MBB3172988.1 hypothetical protein [Endobacter medicaginis]MCX5475232.1 DUF167 domain-containing protein [Endobacter medicaginis]
MRSGACWREDGAGVVVAVRAQPRARRASVGGLGPDGTRLRICVTEAPEDGRASEAVCRALAASLDLPARSVSLRSGGASREKLLFVAAAAERVGPLLDALAERNSP